MLHWILMDSLTAVDAPLQLLTTGMIGNDRTTGVGREYAWMGIAQGRHAGLQEDLLGYKVTKTRILASD
jgi:hypothetical protein